MAAVRPFQAIDREDLLQIGAETAFFGAPIEAYLEDRRFFMDAFYAYYTDYEPQHAWVACDGSRVVGFLTGCIDPVRYQHTLQLRIIPEVLWKLVSGRYIVGPKTGRYIRAAAGAWRRREIPAANAKAYPAHLHINLLPAWRRQGLGGRLMNAYLDQLVELGVPAVHLQTTSMNISACRLYEKLGFRLLDARPTRMYEHLFSHPVENRCYGLRLSG